MEIIDSLLQESDKFMLLMARMGGIAFAPIYSTRNLPVIWKSSFILLISLLAWQYGVTNGYQPPENTIAFLLVMAIEIMVGMIIGLAAQFLFAAVQLAGEIVDTQMGFGIMNVIDPLSGTQAPLIGNFKYILALLVFLQIDGHHYLLEALFDSYQMVPIGQMAFNSRFIEQVSSFFGGIFIIGLKLSLPIVATLLFTDIVMGIMSRTVPQMNIFLVGMPIKVLLGFGVLLVIIPLYIYLMNTLIADLIKQVYQIITTLV